jgi:UDP-glucose 4-epimerase
LTNRILITGGAGFIGSSLAKRLFQSGSEIVILDNFSYGQESNIPFGCEVIKADVENPNWIPLVKPVDYVLHFAAPSSVVLFNKDANKCLTDTIIGTKNVFEYAKKVGVKKVVYPSSSSVYGNVPIPQSEFSQTIPTNLYGVSKLTCEHIARLYSNSVFSTGLRIFAGYGPGEAHKGEVASVITLFVNQIFDGVSPVIFGNGLQRRDFVYIDDIVNAALKCMKNNFVGVINIGSGVSHSFNDLVDLINSLLGTRINPTYAEKPTNYFEQTEADISKMMQVLNVRPTTLEEGLLKLVDFLGLVKKV